MTYKAALAGLAHGGGKSVLIRPKQHFDRVALFRAFGRFVENLGGHYITAEDSGTGLEDMEIIRTVTKHVTGVDVAHGGSGDPSPFTALGVRRGIEACVKIKLGRDSLEGVHVAVQGVGHVGYHLCKELHAAGREDLRRRRRSAQGRARARASSARASCRSTRSSRRRATSSRPAPSARRSTTRPSRSIVAKIVAGAANNQLAQPRHGDDLHARGILYAPDYAINAGGLVNVAQEVLGYDAQKARDEDARDLRHDLRDRGPQREDRHARPTASPT